MVAVEVRDVHKSFKIYHERNNTLKAAIMRGRRSISEEFHALNGITLDIPAGSTFALVGDNGSGKSTLLKCIAKILVPNKGTIKRNGRIAAMLEVGSGFHPELSGRDNVYLNGSILGMSKQEIDARYDEILAFSGVEEFIDQPVKNYSSGMYVRLGFSVAIHTDPEILLVDEILAVGDAAFQEKCARKFVDLKKEGRTVVVVSHSVPQLKNMADYAAWINNGDLEMVGDAHEVLDAYADSTREFTDVDESGKVRWGSGEARIQNVEILHTDGSPVTEALPTGAEIIFRLHYEAYERIDKPVFGFSMTANDGAYLWANNSRDLRFEVDYIDGPGYVDLRIPNLRLQPGLFTIDASIVNTTTEHVYDYMRDVNGFAVKSGVPFESGGYMILDGRWSRPGQPEHDPWGRDER
ncbi:ABC transporter ATP-binding protein [Trueperella bialowiezensis]|uniref:Teichoic acids export ATP-binding protein TagH n=1 Tax=Trueperella bialowiezensis TaxID=312285 RepID=A0A3S4YXE2_9ACTO|nr:ABC transporter ATP-binding protein [Trueperella bialowiezensis]VEI12916.1 Teichoic acids export ATP-binding protein TagH [Trueperella bialowiezensis]